MVPRSSRTVTQISVNITNQFRLATDQTHLQQEELGTEEEQYEANRGAKNKANTAFEIKRLQPIVKPAKFNIPEFDGKDGDSWIQQVGQYFEAARTPLEQTTEFVVSYLKGNAIHWWRSTGFTTQTIPWYKLCGYIIESFAENSICDNVKEFHALK